MNAVRVPVRLDVKERRSVRVREINERRSRQRSFSASKIQLKSHGTSIRNESAPIEMAMLSQLHGNKQL